MVMRCVHGFRVGWIPDRPHPVNEMPYAAKTPCRSFGCGHLAPCPVHGKQPDSRPSAAKRGYDSRLWNAVRKQAFARDSYRCVDCGWQPPIIATWTEAGLGMPAEHLILEELRRLNLARERHLHGDHIQPLHRRPDLRLDLSNIATRCSVCNARKSVVSDRPSRGGGYE